MRTLGYHLVNICLHTTATVLLWQILKRLKVKGALLGAALFAFHPINVMSVTWNERTQKHPLLLGRALRAPGHGCASRASAFMKREGDTKRRWGWYAVMLALFLLAMLAKTAERFPARVARARPLVESRAHRLARNLAAAPDDPHRRRPRSLHHPHRARHQRRDRRGIQSQLSREDRGVGAFLFLLHRQGCSSP